MTGPELDCVVYLGDPDEGAEAIPSAKALESLDDVKAKIEFPYAYGAIVIKDGDEEIADRIADPILQLATKLVKAVPYVIDGEAETALLSESEHGLLLEPSGDDVFISFFAGDAYEPDEFLLDRTSIKLADFGEQVLSMAERLRDLIKACDGEFFENDDYAKSLVEFIDVGRKAYKTFTLEVERGLRVK